ncbi:MAG: hypothetical protein LBI03_00045 [Clostridiales bacterium]|jgi:hypothetical protein|nr:hypothetical protein [Clostridiales bacterium]
MAEETNIDLEFSLLWPDYKAGKKTESERKSGSGKLFNQDLLERDLNVGVIVDSMKVRNEYKAFVNARLMDMCQDPEIITYRQEALQDFINNSKLQIILEDELIPTVLQIMKWEHTNITHAEDIRKIAWRLDILKAFLDCCQILFKYFNEGKFTSHALLKLKKIVNDIFEDPGFINLKEQMPFLLEKTQSVTSITVGINLDNELRPTEAVLLSIEPKPFKQRSLISSLFGRDKNDEKYYGLGAFHSIFKDGSASAFETAILKDLNSLVGDTFKHLANVLGKYEWIKTEFLKDLLPEIFFYTGAARLYNSVTGNGLPMCFPTALPKSKNTMNLHNVYDLSLALKILYDLGITNLDNVVVTNDITMNEDFGEIFILTGANQGGKTTYTRAVGMAQLLFQAGLPVPGSGGEISPADNIYTHFPELEKNFIGEGRLGEECNRLSTILPRLTGSSLLLLNETLSSTSHQECLFISEEIMKYLRTIGARAIYATHLHELAENLDELNSYTPENSVNKPSKFVSLVAGVNESEEMELLTPEGIVKIGGSKRTYKILPMPPKGISFAMDIAKTYGISYEQLVERQKEFREETK